MNTRRILSTAALALAPSLAWAAGEAKVTEFVPDGNLKEGTEAELQGWDGTLKLSANLSLAQNDNVVGQPSGVSFLLGASVVGALEYRSGPHEFRNSLTVLEGFSKTPALDQLVKSSDLAQLESLYSYYLLSWIGGFGRLSFEAPLLSTDDVRATPVVYRTLKLDGTTADTGARSAQNLAGSFDPLTMTQSLGLISKPVAAEPFTLTIRAGFGFRESLAGGTTIVKDDAATAGIIEIKELDDVVQGGAEGAVGLQGKFPEQRLSYGVDFGLLLPFINNDAAGRSAVDLLRIGLTGNVNFSLYEWLFLTYQVKVLSDPQLVDKAQIQNNVLLSFQWELIPARKIEKPAAADPVAEAQAAAKAAEERAAAAEKRAADAEAKLKGEPAPAEPAPAEPAPTPNPQ